MKNISESLSTRILKHVLHESYRPVKPRIISKKLRLSEEEEGEVRLVIKKLVQRGMLAYGAKHLVLPPNDREKAAALLARRESQSVAAPSEADATQAPADATDPATETAQPADKPREKRKRRRKPQPAATHDDSASPDDAASHVESPAQSATPAEPPAKKTIPDDGRHLTGVFRRTLAGHGFVRPTGSAPGADRTLDVYISREHTADAAQGDIVLVRLSRGRPDRESRRPNPLGRVVEVIERDTHRFVGTYYEDEGSALVRVDGKVFSDPIEVGDPGAKGAATDDKVVIEMARFPTAWHRGEAVIIEVLGPKGSPRVDTLSIIHEFDLPGEFPDNVLDEARQQADRFEEAGLGSRVDLSADTVITIDPVDARDFDDAISLSRLENGHWRLGVHIADVSHFVRPDTALDREAYSRATSVYLPDRVIPMLPEIISNSLASLQPEKLRYTKTAFIEFTEEGIPVDAEFVNAAIRSQRRFSYEEVDDFLAHRARWKETLAPDVHRLLGEMHTLAMTLRARRMTRGALELTMPEVKIDLDREGRVCGAHLVENTESHQIIEEFMLAANEAVARHLHKKGLAFLRRVHSAPNPRKLKALTDFVRGLGIEVDSLESRFELQRLLREVAARPEQHAVNYAILRSLQRAVYSPAEEGHYALASDCYCHFTSPIRRYPDLTVHRLLDALFEKRRPRADISSAAVAGEHCSQREQRAEQAERELTKLKLLAYLQDRIGMRMEAIITGVEEFGIFARGVELPAEGMIHVTALGDDFYRFDRTHHTLEGRRAGNTFRLGDRIEVEVARVDQGTRDLDFRIVGRGPRRPSAEPRPNPNPRPKPAPEPRARDSGNQQARPPRKKSSQPRASGKRPKRKGRR